MTSTRSLTGISAGEVCRHRMRAFARFSLAPGVCGMILGATSTWAAEQPDATSEVLEQIVVTARQRSEILIDVPETIRAISSQEIRSAGITSVEHLEALVPNFSVTTSQDAGLVMVNIRGIGQVRNGEPPMAFIIDGVQLSSPDQIKQPLFDLESIEVLKGPQGALYGRNAIGGALIINTRAPSEEFSSTIEAGYGNGNDRKLQAVASGPLFGDSLFFRVSGDWRDFDGLIPNVTLGTEADFAEDRNVRARIDYRPSDALSIELRGSYGDLYQGGNFIPMVDGHPNDTSIPVQAGINGDSTRRLKDASLKFDYRAAGGTLTGVTSWSEVFVHMFEELGGGIPNPVLSAMQDRSSEAVSQDLRWSSDAEGRLRYTAGVYYLHNRRKIITDLYTLNSALQRDTQIPIAYTRDINDAYAAYGQLNYDLTEALELTLALRYDQQDVEQIDLLHGSTHRKESYDALQPKVSLAYKITPDTLVYATYAEGFRSGGFNPPTALFPHVYESETTKNIEAGVKLERFDRRLRVDLAGYHTDDEHQATHRLLSGVQGITTIPQVELYGVDLSAMLRAAPGLDLIGGFGWNHGRIKDFDGTDLYVGNVAPLTYEYSYNIGVQHVLPLGAVTLTSRADYSSKRGLYWQVDNKDEQSPVDLLNVRISAAVADWEFTAYAENLLDERYIAEFCASEFCGSRDLGWPSTPRRYGMTVRYSF
ncbi:MAG TPA: TonB-dependent receptor [Steroidobacter sp.]|uniref:TonB-dependent receptor n=1 Tax=Steroidobacter sp. TaxID=1978227 RepID=UPI002ED9B1A4